MGQKIKIAGWVSVGVIAGALTTVSLQTVARGAMTPLPLEEIQQLSAVFGLIKTDYVEPVDDKKLITDADRKSTRLNSSHLVISYAVFCLKKKKTSTASLPQLHT